MTEPDLMTTYADIDAALSRLVAVAAEDLAGAAMPSGDPTAPITTGGGTSDPTGSSVSSDGTDRTVSRLGTARDYQTIMRGLVQIAGLCQRLEERVTRALTGETCLTPGCRRIGMSNWHGRCEKCGPWMLANHGISPHTMVAKDDAGNPIAGSSLVDDWNAQIRKDCDCPTSCCPDGCTDLVAQGQRVSQRCAEKYLCRCDDGCCPDGCDDRQEHGRLSERCHKRQQRNTVRTSSGDVAFAWRDQT